MRRNLANWMIVTGLVFFYLTASFLTACAKQEEQPPKAASESTTAPAPPPPVTGPKGDAFDLRTAIIQVAQKNIPAVAHIEVTQRQEIANPFLPFENDPFFRFFFDVPRDQKSFKRELKGLGTGMVMDAQGNILTNNHVVGGATEIKVLLSNGKEYPAKVVGADPKTDLAVIKIEAGESLPFVTFGDSDKVEVGEWVVAIGHPRGLDQTVTQGIISAKHRRGITDPSSYQDFLQTDAAINPGNSGGPLLTLQGEVIGVNAAIVSESGGYEGIGFAIPSNMALHVAKALLAHGKVERGWLGVSAQEVNPDLAKSFGLDMPKGALIGDVTKDGPADKAGIKRGDIVLMFNGKEIADASALRNEAAGTPIGQEIKVTVWRDKKSQEITVKIGNLEEMTKIASASIKDRLGAEVRSLTSAEVSKYGLSSGGGVVITWLDPNGPMAASGFELEDLVLAMNNQPITNVDEFANLVAATKSGEKVAMLAMDHRRGNSGYVQVVVR
jgi:serine protease Do